MNDSRVSGATGCAVLLLCGSLSFIQADDRHDQPGSSESPVQISPGFRLNHLSESDARKSLNTENTAGGASTFSGRASAVLGLPSWTYSVKSPRDGRTYTGQIVGQNPTAGGQTIVPTYVIPIKLVFRYSSTTSYTFDPTAADNGCLGQANTALSLTVQSPIFTDYPFTLVSSGDDNTQYADHFNRANFWSNMSASASTFHTLLGGPIVEPVQTVTVNASNGFFASGTVYSVSGLCGTNTGNTNHAGYLGVVNINSWDPVARSLISHLGLNATELPVFVFYNAVLSQGSSSNLNNCCILGYHNAVGSPVQTYAVAEFEGRDQTLFTGVADVAAMSHEINEWMQDPGGNNLTPAWGNVGQVSGCQSNYEVGDPLSGTLLPGILGSNGFTYHLQELAFFSWFYGGPSIGINGWFSDNNTFKIQAATCPPGGA